MTESYGALVGWGHHDVGDRVMLRIESVRSREAGDEHDPDMFRVLMTKQQAAVLGNTWCAVLAKHRLVRRARVGSAGSSADPPPTPKAAYAIIAP